MSIGEGFVAATRSVPTESCFGLDRQAVLMVVCQRIDAPFSAMARRLDFGKPPMDARQMHGALSGDA